MSTVTKYNNSTRDNFMAWRRDVDSIFAKHVDKLNSVVNDGKIAKSVEIKLRTQYKSLGEDFNQEARAEHLKEFNATAYYILIDTISDQTTRKTIERKFGDATDGMRAYAHIVDLWKADVLDDRVVAKDAERTMLISKGAKSASLAHMSEFVEELLAINNELVGTDFAMKDAVVVTHVLTALRKHNRAYVDGFKGRFQGVADWNVDFDKVWGDLRKGLESADIADVADVHAVDVLTTTVDPRDARIAELECKLDQLVTTLSNLTDASGARMLRTMASKE